MGYQGLSLCAPWLAPTHSPQDATQQNKTFDYIDNNELFMLVILKTGHVAYSQLGFERNITLRYDTGMIRVK